MDRTRALSAGWSVFDDGLPAGFEVYLLDLHQPLADAAGRAEDDEVRNAGLSPAEARRAARIRHPRAQRRFVARRLALRDLLSPMVCSWRCPTCGSAEHGVPTVTDRSVSTSSHEDCFAVALGPAGWEVGVDLTGVFDDAQRRAARSTFTTAESAGGLAAEEVWVRKEAIGKAQGLGLTGAEPRSRGGPLDTEVGRWSYSAWSMVWGFGVCAVRRARGAETT